MKKQVSFLYLFSLFLFMLASQIAEAQGIKEISDLSSEELDVANGICQKVLKDYFGDSAIAWYNTTYNYLPTSDEDIVPDLSTMKKLITPVKVVSVIGVAIAYRFDKVKRELKQRIVQLEASHHGKRYHIVKSLVLVEPGGGGGTMGMSYDKVTIIPYVVTIY